MKSYDIIIIGTGLTGLYLGYRLIQKKYKGNVLFLSKDSKPGGRICSYNLPKLIGECNKDNFKVEICASRYYDSQPLINNLSNELLMKITKNKAIPIVTPYEKYTYINSLSESYEISIPSAIPNSSLEFALQSGYYFLNQNMALSYVFTDYPTSNVPEIRFQNGFEYFAEKIEEIVSKHYDIKYNEEVTTIKKDKNYLINNIYISKKIVYTGIFSDFNNLITTIPNLLNRRLLIEKYLIAFPSIKCYINYSKPFWGNKRYKYTGHLVINQVILYSKTVLLIYLVGETANTLINMLPIDIREQYMNEYKSKGWQDKNKFETLLSYITSELPGIINSSLEKYKLCFNENQLNSATHMIVQYKPQATGFLKTIKYEKVNTIFDNIQKGDNFYYLTSDVNDNGGGWVERGFELVENHLQDITL